MKRKLIGIGAVVLVLALLLTLAPSCGKGEEEGAPTPSFTPTPGVTLTPTPEVKTLKIGSLMPMSGPGAPWGIQFEQGFDWAVDKVNTRGGIKVGDDIYMIKTVKGNSKMIGSAATIEATRMVYEEGIHYIVGPITTHQAVEPILRENKRFMVCPSTDLPIGPDHPYNIMTAAPSSDFLAPLQGVPGALRSARG